MSRPLTWSQLTKGLIVVAVVLAAAMAILTFARVGALRGETITLYMVTNTASGVIDGTEVWLGGQKVGVVSDVRFRSPSSDTSERITIEMHVLKEHAGHIRKDSDVQIRPGASLIGEPVIYITVGSAIAAAVNSHDTIRARAQLERRPSRAQMIAALGDSIVSVAKLTKQVLAHADTTQNQISRLRARTEDQVDEVGQAIKQFTQRRSSGIVMQVSSDTILHTTISRIAARADSIRQLTSSDRTTIGRFRKDSTLLVEMRRTRASIDTARARLARLSLSADENASLRRELDRVDVQLDSLMRDAKRNPLKYLSL